MESSLVGIQQLIRTYCVKDLERMLPEWTVYHSPEWLAAVSGFLGCTPLYLIVTKGSALALAPSVKTRRGRIAPPPLSMYGHMITSDWHMRSDFAAAMIRHLSQAARRWSLKVEGEVEAQRWTSGTTEMDARIPLRSTSREQWQSLPGKVRRNINKAYGFGVEPEIRRDALDDYYRLLVLTRKRLNIPITPTGWLKEILQMECCSLIVAYHKDEAVAGVLFIEDKFNVHYAVPVTSRAGMAVRAPDLLVWSLIVRGIEQGKCWLRMGGADVGNVGLRRYKAKWGAEERKMVELSEAKGGKSNNVASKLPIWRYMPAKVSEELALNYLRYFW